LCEALGNESRLVLLDSSIWASLDTKNPLAANDLSSFGPRDNVINVKLLPSSHFIFTSCEPLDSIGTGHGFIISLWLGDLSISKVGTGTVGGNVVSWVIVGNGKTNGTLETRVGWHSRGSESGRCGRISGGVDRG
jgi:hypothetical protein